MISVPPLVSQARGRTLVSIDSIDSKDETRLLPLNIIINPFTTRTTRTSSPAPDRRTVASSRRRTRPRRPHPPNHARTRRFLRAASLTRLSARAPAPRLEPHPPASRDDRTTRRTATRATNRRRKTNRRRRRPRGTQSIDPARSRKNRKKTHRRTNLPRRRRHLKNRHQSLRIDRRMRRARVARRRYPYPHGGGSACRGAACQSQRLPRTRSRVCVGYRTTRHRRRCRRDARASRRIPRLRRVCAL